jgi:ATP-dependent helicase/nuclease subunit A
MDLLTPFQRRALQRNLNLAVTAGAGTGKTRVLVERYLDLLLSEPVDIREILAITFTNKAAAEMMNRVAGRLDELLEQEADLSRRRELLLLRDRLNAAYISTIHSFCLRILREYPVEAGLDPDFNQLNEMQNELLIEQTIRTELEKISTDEQQWLDLFRLFGTSLVEELLHNGLTHRFEMQPLLQKYQNSTAEVLYRELNELFLEQVGSAFREYPFDQLLAVCKSILQQFPATKPDNEKVMEVLEIITRFSTCTDRSLAEFWINLFDLARTCTTGKATAYKVLTPLGGDKSWKNGTAAQLKHLSELLVPIARWVMETPLTPPGKMDLYILQQLPKLYQLYRQVEKNFTATKKEQGWIDFEDMLLLVRELLQHNTELRNRIAAQFKYILVDEFQDTNLLQWEIIACLGEMTQNKFFIVGDAKQSIYGFRNADVRVFNRVRREFCGDLDLVKYPGNVIFSENFRFKDNLTCFINACFSRIMQRSETNQWEVEYGPLSTKRRDAAGGQVELALLEEKAESDLQAEFVAGRIKQILAANTVQPGQIAVLLRTRNHLTAVEEQLRRQDVPFKTIGGIGFYQRQEIYDVYHLLRFLLDPYDDPALIGILRSPFANISDEGLLFLALANTGKSFWEKLEHPEAIGPLDVEERDRLIYFRHKAENWLNRRDRIYFSELLRDIFQQSGYRAVMCAQLQGEQLAANLDKILELAAEYEQTGFATISEFTGYLRNLIHTQVKEGEAPLALEDRFTVKIMTIHQAKGLEFPVVFLPYLEQKIRSPRTDEACFDEGIGLISRIRKSGLPPTDPVTESFCLLDLVRRELRLKELAELKRLFYVGCSRARDQLILSACCTDEQVPAETPLHWLLQAMQRQPGEFAEGEELKWEKSTIHIRRTPLTVAGNEGDPTFGKVYGSLQQLRERVNQNHVPGELPLFLSSAADHPTGEIFSATQLMAFRQNATEYYRRYHLGYFEGDYESFRLASSAEEKALLKGKLLHRYLQFYPRQEIEHWLFEFEISDQNLIQELKQEIQELAGRIQNSPFIRRVLAAGKSHNEVKVFMQLDTDFITGTLDKLFQNENGQWEILDYKTNRIDPAQVPEVMERYRLQTQTYALLLAHLYPRQAEYAVNFYFTHLDLYHPTVFTSSDIPGLKQNFIKIIREIKNHFEPYRPA